MITYEQALSADEFHLAHRMKGKVHRWRRNGTTKTWKTRPGHFRIPVKYGLYQYGYITHDTASHFHVAGHCQVEGEWLL